MYVLCIVYCSEVCIVYWQEEGDWYRSWRIREVPRPTAAGATWTIQSAFDRFLDQIKKKYSQTCFDGFHDWSFHRFTWNYSSGHNAPIERVIPGIDCLIHSRSDNMNTTRERQTIVKSSMTHIAPYIFTLHCIKADCPFRTGKDIQIISRHKLCLS